MGLGSLWIGDVFIAYGALCKWPGETGELIALMSFGVADESPADYPRKTMSELAASSRFHRWCGRNKPSKSHIWRDILAGQVLPALFYLVVKEQNSADKN